MSLVQSITIKRIYNKELDSFTLILCVIATSYFSAELITLGW